MDSHAATVLHVEPDDEVRQDVAERMSEDEDFSVTGVADIESGLQREGKTQVDCIVTAYELPDGTAFDLVTEVRERSPDVGCVLYTAEGPGEIETGGYEDTVVEYLSTRIPGAENRLPELVRNVVSGRLQVGYPVPDDENDRLATLDEYEFEDESLTAALDRLTALVKSHFEVDVVLVGVLFDHEEVTLACRGTDQGIINRVDAIGAYTVLDPDVTVIEDVQSDQRFGHNEHCREFSVRSYASANLTTAEGYVLGELCLVDGSPRSYGEQEKRDLQLFADEIVEQFDLRRRLAVGVGE